MANRLLNIVETAYRATIEEQDDPVLWLVHTLRGQGAEADVLLRGAAVGYALQGQDASGLRFGAKLQTQPADLAGALGALADNGAKVYFVQEDARRRGLTRSELIAEVEPIAEAQLPRLLDTYHRVWHW